MLKQNKKLSLNALNGIKAKKDKIKAKFDIRQGVQGIQGAQGIQGERGLQGESIAGPRGPQGAKGEKGDTGEAGRGIVRLQIKKFDLIVTYTDGEKVNLGRVVGDRGPRGDKGQSGYAFGDSTVNNTNITEEVLSPEDSANLAAISPAIDTLIRDQHDQLLRVEKELRFIKTHLHIVTGEELNESDIGRDEQ